MPRKDHVVVGIHIHNRARQALEIQRILGESGRIIRTRLGLHEVAGPGQTAGVIILELIGTPAAMDSLIRKLRGCRGVQVKKLVFSHS